MLRRILLKNQQPTLQTHKQLAQGINPVGDCLRKQLGGEGVMLFRERSPRPVQLEARRL
jgi:hypothetical protein